MKKIILLSTILVLFSSLAFASWIDVEKNSDFQPGYFQFDSDNNGSYDDLYPNDDNYYGWGALAGEFKIDIYTGPSNNTNLQYTSYGFCVDLLENAGDGNATFASLNTIHNGNKVALLLNEFWDIADNDLKKAALQFAIWDTIYDETDLENGIERFNNFFSRIDGLYTQFSIYTNYISGLSSLEYTGDQYTILHFEGLQDIIIKNPVPEPATLLLFGFGLLGLGAMGRKKG